MEITRILKKLESYRACVGNTSAMRCMLLNSFSFAELAKFIQYFTGVHIDAVVGM